MKQLLTLVVAATIIINSNLHGQFKIKTDGKIGIGTLSPTANVEIYSGTTKFNRSANGGVTVVPFIIDWEYQHPRLYPNTNHNGYIGMPNFWNQGRFDIIYYTYSCTQYSDKKFKKNVTPFNQIVR
jgi:hypothetical protein